jgi:hypothetical protein
VSEASEYLKQLEREAAAAARAEREALLDTLRGIDQRLAEMSAKPPQRLVRKTMPRR